MPWFVAFPAAVVFGLITLIVEQNAAWAEKRVALVIGNGAYQHARRLSNPTQDANAIAELFRRANFEKVVTLNDVSNSDFRLALHDFLDVAQNSDIAVVFYAGHGVQMGEQNFLIPVDAKLLKEYDVKDEAVSLERIEEAIEPAKRLRLIILDACRDNPFLARMQRTHVVTRQAGVTSGLAKQEPHQGDTLIAYAAKVGSTADDGDGKHSPFTSALLNHLAAPGLDIRLAFGRIRDEVRKNTNNEQEPFVYGALGGSNISLVPAPEVPTAAVLVAAKGDYELVERIDKVGAWEVFINTFKTGYYVELAKERLKMLEAEQPVIVQKDQKTIKVAALPPDKPDSAGPMSEPKSVEEAKRIAEIRKAEEAAKAEQARKAQEAQRIAESKKAEEAAKAEQARKAEEEALRIAEAKKAEEAARVEAARKAQEARRIAESKKAEEAAKAEQARKAEEEALRIAEAKKAEEAARVEAARKAQEARRIAESKKAEEAAKAEQARKAEEEALRIAEAKKAEEAAKAEQARKAQEAQRIAEAKKAEEAARVEAASKAQEAQRIAESKKAEEAAKAEQARKAQVAQRIAEAKKAEEAARVEAARKAQEAQRIAEAKKAEEAAKAEQARREQVEAQRVAMAEKVEEPAKAACDGEEKRFARLKAETNQRRAREDLARFQRHLTCKRLRPAVIALETKLEKDNAVEKRRSSKEDREAYRPQREARAREETSTAQRRQAGPAPLRGSGTGSMTGVGF